MMMNESEPSAGQKLQLPEPLRWILFVPAAVVASWLGAGVGSVFVFTRNPGYAEFLFPLLFLLPSGVAFTLVGAMVAPRYRVAIAICLAAWCSIQSLCVHIITQPSPGLTNYMHATGQTLGSVIGVASVLYFVIRARLEVTA
jgi:hypothetical protein